MSDRPEQITETATDIAEWVCATIDYLVIDGPRLASLDEYVSKPTLARKAKDKVAELARRDSTGRTAVRENRASTTTEAQMTWNTFRLEFDDDGTLWQRGREGWREPVCGVCSEPIRWVLDMASFKHEQDGFVLCHARCVWTKEAFEREREAAPDG